MKKIKRKVEEEQLNIIKDTREQNGYVFEDHNVIVRKLETGDYSLENFESIITIERKQLFELYGNFGKDRERFLKEIERMRNIPYKFLIIEGNLDKFLEGNKFSKLSTKCLVGSLISLIFKHNIHIVFAGNKELAENITMNILRKAKKYLEKGDIL